MKKLFIIALLIGVQGALFAQKTLTLQECITLATDNNLTLRQVEAGVAYSEKAASQSRLLLLPNLNVGSSYFWNFGYTIDPVTNLPLSNSFQTNGYQATSTMNLFSGGSIYNTIQKSKTDLQVSGMNYKEVVENIQFQVIVAYLSVMFAEEQVKVSQQKINTSESQLSNSRKLANAGSIPAGDLLTLEAQLAQDQLSLIQAANQLDKTKLDLKLLLQMNVAEDIQVAFPDVNQIDKILYQTVPDALTVANYAIENKASIKKYDYQLMSDEYSKKIAAASALPTLSLIGQVGTNYSNAIYPPYITESEPYGTQVNNNLSEVVGISLQIPIFNNGQVLISKENANLAYYNTQLNQQIAINTLRQNVTQAVNDLKSAIASYSAAEKSFAAAASAFEFAEKKFNIGTASSFDYTTAMNAKAQAESMLVQAKYDLIFKSKIIDYYLDKPLEF